MWATTSQTIVGQTIWALCYNFRSLAYGECFGTMQARDSIRQRSMIRIHFPNFAPGNKTIPLVYALLQNDSARLLQEPRYQVLRQQAGQFWTASDAQQADLWIDPDGEPDENRMQRISLQAKQAGKPCLFFINSDLITPVKLPHGTVYRTSIDRRRLTANEQGYAAFCPNLKQDHPDLFRPRIKQETPTVSFCGFVGTPLQRLAYRLTGRWTKVLGLSLRHRVTRHLQQADGVQTRFILRDTFGGTAMKPDAVAQKAIRMEYLQNLADGDYVLCVRGAGNFSFRFYETLAAGRIPLFVDTHCVLPLENQIHWPSHGLWISQDQIPRIGSLLVRFHQQLSPQAFVELQQRNHRLWMDHLEPCAFYRRSIEQAMQPPCRDE